MLTEKVVILLKIASSVSESEGILYHSPAGLHEIYLTLAWIIRALFAFAFFDGLAKFSFDDSNLSPGASYAIHK